MKLASIISVWADAVCILPFCIDNHLKFCDAVIVVWSQNSNHFVKNDAVFEFMLADNHDSRVEFVQLEPVKGLKPLANETRKRNHGIDVARKKGFTHFMCADADEMYHPHEMEQDKKLFSNPDLKGLTSSLIVYVGKPTLWCEDHTLVPTIHKLTKEVYVGNFKEYPFAYTGLMARIDPSRRPSFYKDIQMGSAVCCHFSYVRKDIDLKIDNSSANLKNSREAIREHVKNAAPGYKSGYGILKESQNFFNLPIW